MILGLIGVVLVGAAWWHWQRRGAIPPPSNNGNPSPQAVVPQPSTDIAIATTTMRPAYDFITVTKPHLRDLLVKQTVIEGEAKGEWYSADGTFVVRIVDGKGADVAGGIAKALRDWKTDEFVPFRATLTVPFATVGKGWLILERSNPTNDPAKKMTLRLPVGLSVK